MAEDSGPVDTTALTASWEQRWAGHRAVPHELRGARDRWVRFHALPESKRYPATAAEHEIVLARHRTLVAELLDGPDLLLMTAGYSDRPVPLPADRDARTMALDPAARYWRSSCLSDDVGYESWLHLHVSRITWPDERVDGLLRHVADGELADVLLADPRLRWLYHPYDGGMDVLLPASAERDALRERHAGWRPAGGGDL